MFLESDFQRFPVITLSVAGIALHIDVRQKVHLDLDDTVTLTRFASAALSRQGLFTEAGPASIHVGKEHAVERGGGGGWKTSG